MKLVLVQIQWGRDIKKRYCFWCRGILVMVVQIFQVMSLPESVLLLLQDSPDVILKQSTCTSILHIRNQLSTGVSWIGIHRDVVKTVIWGVDRTSVVWHQIMWNWCLRCDCYYSWKSHHEIIHIFQQKLQITM